MIDHQGVLSGIPERIADNAADLLDQCARRAKDTVEGEGPETWTIHPLEQLVLMGPILRVHP